jgi:hypothetical protein
MRTPARMLATATLIALTVLPAGVAQASQAEERGQRVQERTWAEKHHTVPAPANPATPTAELRTQAREQGAYPAPTGQQTANALEQFRRGERASQDQTGIADDSRWPPTDAQVGESWRHPGNVRARSTEPSGRPGWLVPGLGVLAAALVLAGGLAVTTRRARRRVRVGQAA